MSPNLSQLFNNYSLIELVNQHLPNLKAATHMIKIQINKGDGGCFPLHFDTYGKNNYT